MCYPLETFVFFLGFFGLVGLGLVVLTVLRPRSVPDRIVSLSSLRFSMRFIANIRTIVCFKLLLINLKK